MLLILVAGIIVTESPQLELPSLPVLGLELLQKNVEQRQKAVLFFQDMEDQVHVARPKSVAGNGLHLHITPQPNNMSQMRMHQEHRMHSLGTLSIAHRVRNFG